MQKLNLSLSKVLRILGAAVLLAVFARVTWMRGSRNLAPPAWTGPAMGTTYTIKLAAALIPQKKLGDLQREIEDILQELDRQLSTYRPDSEISRFNRDDSTAPFAISASFAEVCRAALRVSELSGGTFDPTVNRLVDLWGFGSEGRPGRVPSDEEIAAVLKFTGYRHVKLEGSMLRKDIPGVRLDLGAIAPGRGADEIAKVIRRFGVTDYFVELGGEIVAAGLNPDGRPWSIGIDQPVYEAAPGETFETIVRLSGLALATSGDYRNYFRDEKGEYYTHIMNPALGRPVRGRTASVTVVAADGMTADALSTALFVLGPEKGAALLTNYPGSSAFFILRRPDGAFAQILTPGFAETTGFTPSPNRTPARNRY